MASCVVIAHLAFAVGLAPCLLAEVYWVRFAPKAGQEMGDRHPAVIIERSDSLDLDTVLVVPGSSNVDFHRPVEDFVELLRIDARDRLSKRTVFLADSVLAVSRQRIDTRYGLLTQLEQDEFNIVTTGVRGCLHDSATVVSNTAEACAATTPVPPRSEQASPDSNVTYPFFGGQVYMGRLQRDPEPGELSGDLPLLLVQRDDLTVAPGQGTILAVPLQLDTGGALPIELRIGRRFPRLQSRGQLPPGRWVVRCDQPRGIDPSIRLLDQDTVLTVLSQEEISAALAALKAIVWGRVSTAPLSGTQQADGSNWSGVEGADDGVLELFLHSLLLGVARQLAVMQGDSP